MDGWLVAVVLSGRLALVVPSGRRWSKLHRLVVSNQSRCVLHFVTQHLTFNFLFSRCLVLAFVGMLHFLLLLSAAAALLLCHKLPAMPCQASMRRQEHFDQPHAHCHTFTAVHLAIHTIRTPTALLTNTHNTQHKTHTINNSHITHIASHQAIRQPAQPPHSSVGVNVTSSIHRALSPHSRHVTPLD